MAISVKAAPVDSVSLAPYPYVTLLDHNQDASLIRLTDDDFLTKAGKVVFRVNRYDVFSNDSLLRQLEHEVLPIVNRDSIRLARLILRVASSPEGSAANNHQLSLYRAKTLTDFLRSRLVVPVEESSFDIEVVDEDYRLLCAMMRQSKDADYDEVQRLYDKYRANNDFARLKSDLQRLRHGHLWQRLLRIYFPHLRAARLVLVFERPAVKQVVLPAVQPALADSITHTTSAVDVKPVDVAPTPEFTSVQERDPRRELLSVKTNVLLDFAYVPFGYDRWCPIPNVALEYYPKHGHFTYGASIDFPWWRHYWDFKYFELRNYQLEARYYLRSGDISKNPPGKGKAYRGLYLQAYVHGGLYCFSLNIDRGYVGEYLGGGIGGDVNLDVPFVGLALEAYWNYEMIFDVEYDWKAEWVYGWDQTDLELFGALGYTEPSVFNLRRYYTGQAGNDAVTVAYNCRFKTGCDKKGESVDVAGGRVLTFGICGLTPRKVRKPSDIKDDYPHYMDVNLQFNNGMDSTFVFDVTDQVRRRFKGGVLTVELDMDSITIPHRKGGSAFDAVVKDYEDGGTHEFEM